MRILISPDKFKHSLTAAQVCDAVEEGLKSVLKNIEVVKLPLADGGEGTTEILTQLSGGKIITTSAHDPLFRKLEASYGLSGDGPTAYIEMSSASGLHLLHQSERNPLKTSTLGTGELIKHALLQGVKKIILGIGGSATNDGGIGMAAAMGYTFLDNNNNKLQPTGENLINIKKINSDHLLPELKGATVWAMCDVQNPLTGIEGASFVFGPQKGASEEHVRALDDGLANLAVVVDSDLKQAIADIPGAGAGGGIGGGAIAFLNAELKSGIELVMQLTAFENQVKLADIIITGEGKMDAQTLQGKVVAGVAAVAKKYHKRVLAITGRNTLDKKDQQSLCIDQVFALTDFENEEVAMKEAYQLLTRITSEHIASVI